MMILDRDTHTHTIFSPDGQDTPDAMCAQALAQGLQTIAFTEHVEWHPPARCQPDFPRYFEDLATCREKYGPQGLQVLSGVEIGNPHQYPDEVATLLKEHELDVIIISLHWLSGENIQRQSCFSNGDAGSVYEAYFTDLAYMAAIAKEMLPVQKTVIAHFDRIFWPGVLADARPDLARLEPIVRDVWQVVAASGAALELNTRLLSFSPGWRYELATMLRWYWEAGGQRIVVNSDAHRTEHLGLNFPLASRFLQTAGFGSEQSIRHRESAASRFVSAWQ